MKFTLSTAKSVTKPVAKKFDFVKAEEALIQSFDRISDSYRALVAAEGRVAECERVIQDCQLATESIRQFGVTATTMGIFNGKDHALDRALGLEDLAIASLESMSTASKKLLQGKYLAGLEDNSKSAWETFKDAVEKWMNKFIAWLTEVFTGSAKLVRMVKEATFENFDPAKTVNVLSKDQCAKALENMKTALDMVNDNRFQAGDKMQNTALAVDKLEDIGEKKEGKAAELGWTDATVIKGIAAQFLQFAQNGSFNAMDGAWKKIQAEYKNDMARATDQGMIDQLKDKFARWQEKGKVTGDFNKNLRAVGLTLYTLSKAVKEDGDVRPDQSYEQPKA